jgi:hypothetical protein
MYEYKDLFVIISILVMVNFGVSLLIFAQLTVHPLEKKIKSSGGELPKWDNMGIRISSYAFSLICRIKETSAQMVDENSVRKFATKNDRIRAIYTIASLAIFLLFAILYSLFFDTN